MTRLLLIAALTTLVATAATAITLTLSDGASARSAVLQQVPVDQLPPPPTLPLPLPPVVVDPAIAAPGVPHLVTLRVGDTMVVEDAEVGCQIGLRNEQVVVECRRDGQVRGTYMTLIGKRGAKLARFRSADAAKVIVGARHGGGWRACGSAARAARAGGGMCR
jgi:hypothetical protein